MKTCQRIINGVCYIYNDVITAERVPFTQLLPFHRVCFASNTVSSWNHKVQTGQNKKMDGQTELFESKLNSFISKLFEKMQAKYLGDEEYHTLCDKGTSE